MMGKATYLSNKNVLSIGAFLRREFVILFLFCFGLSHFFFDAYCLYAMAPLIFILPIKAKIDNDAIFWLLFGILYLMVSYLHPYMATKRNLDWLFFYPMICYMMGKYLATKYCTNGYIICFSYLLLFICFSGRELFSIIDSMRNGGLISDDRIITDEKGNNSYTATLYGLYLCVLIAGLGLLFERVNNHLETLIKYVAVGFGVISLLAMLYLLTRGSLVVAFAVISFSLLQYISALHGARRIVIISTLSFFIFILFVILSQTFYFDIIYQSFSERNEFDGRDLGGRMGRWQDALELIPISPLGTETGMLVSENYLSTWAHNMWLDCFLHAGWINGVILFVLSFSHFINVVKIQNLKIIPQILRHYMFSISITILIACSFEPTIDSVYGLFLIFVFHCGSTRALQINSSKFL